MTIKMALATASETITEKVRDSFSSSFRSVGGAPMGAGVTRLAGGLQIYGARERNPSGAKHAAPLVIMQPTHKLQP